MEAFGVVAQRTLLAALAALVAIVFWTGTTDPVNLPKATLAAVTAGALLVIGAVRVLALRRITLLAAPVAWAAAALGVGLLVATVTSDVPAASWSGVLGRSDGLLLYAACVVCFLTVLSVYDADSVRLLVYGLLAGGVFLASYGLLQSVGIDSVNWADVGISMIIGTVGNPDFEAAYVGIMLPLSVWGALTRTWGIAWRAASGVLAAACVAVAVVSSSSQGLLAGAAGLAVLGVAVLLARGDQVGRRAAAVLVALGALLGTLAVLGVATGVGPGDRLVSAESLTARKWYWSAALDMWAQHPVKGVGLDRYGAYYRSFRPDAAAAVNNYSDAAHNVPLHLLATGGVVVAVPYLVVTSFVACALVRGILRLDGEARLLLAGTGGAWIAYQVQSLVSIDQPTLAVTHWLLAGAVIVIAAPAPRRERLLPGAVMPRSPKGRSVAITGPPSPNWSAATIAGISAITVLALVGAWQVLTPLRADRAHRVALEQLASGRGNAALASFDSATERAPHVASYWLSRGRFLERVQQQPLAAQSYDSGLEGDPRSYDLLVAAAQLAEKRGDGAAVARYSARLHGVDPSDRWRSELGG